MDLQTAIERAKSALEERIAQTSEHDLPRSEWRARPIVVSELKEKLHLDTEALQTLREWKPEEKE